MVVAFWSLWLAICSRGRKEKIGICAGASEASNICSGRSLDERTEEPRGTPACLSPGTAGNTAVLPFNSTPAVATRRAEGGMCSRIALHPHRFWFLFVTELKAEGQAGGLSGCFPSCRNECSGSQSSRMASPFQPERLSR